MNHYECYIAAKVAVPCSANDVAFGGKCMNCGYDPAKSGGNMNKYEQQADDFLKRNKLKMSINKVAFTPPVWDDNNMRNKYKVVIRRRKTFSSNKQVSFDFWGSAHDAIERKDPTQYDILTCIGGDIMCPDTFEEFCSEYGYNEDSRNAEKTFRRANAFAKKLRSFFSEEEITELREIQ